MQCAWSILPPRAHPLLPRPYHALLPTMRRPVSTLPAELPSPFPPEASTRGQRRAVAATALAAATLGVLGTFLVVQMRAAGAGHGPTAASGSLPHFMSAVRQAEEPRTIAGHDVDCAAGNYSTKTLKLIAEQPLAGLLAGPPPANGRQRKEVLPPPSRFEASDVTGVAGSNEVFIVFDNTFRIGHVATGVPYMAAASGDKGADRRREVTPNRLLTWPNDDGAGSEFEGLAYNATSGRYLVVQETVVNGTGTLVPRIHEVSLDGGEAKVHSTCDGAMAFESEKKGMEGAAIATAADGTFYLLALCEGNGCAKGDASREPGGGRVLVMEREATGPRGCSWVVVQTVAIPPSAAFQDYASISIYENRRVAVVSQENAAVWVGELDLLDGRTDQATRQRSLFGLSGGEVYDFPRNDHCARIFCNVEGVHWLTADTLIAVSDEMKSGGRQPFVCREHDQSIHTFQVPAPVPEAA